jgi:hypothetical protein
MQNLQELVDIVTIRRLKAAGAPDFPDAPTRYLYELVAGGQFKKEEALNEAFQKSYPEVSILPVKQQLKKFLHRMLLLVDLNQSHYQLRQKGYFECHRNWAAIKILVGKNARFSAVDLAIDLLQQSRKYDFTDIALDIARTLRLQYGSIFGDLKKYEQYSKLAKDLDAVVRAENLSEELYTDLAARFVNNKSAKEEVHEQAVAYFEQIAPFLAQYDTYKLHLCGRLIEVLIYSSVNDYKHMVLVCQRAITFFEAKAYVANVPLQAFYYQSMVCCVQLQDYEHGKKIANKGIQLLEDGTYNWFKYQELLIILAFHTKAYQDAYKVLKGVILHRKFGSLPENTRQYWKIIEAYQYYLKEMGIIVEEGDTSILSRFRIARFANETPLFSKDKRGLNIPILIFQIVYLIQQKRQNETIDRLEAIKRYSTRYLVKDDTYRSNCFIKMLLVIPDVGFHKVATERHADKFAKLLKAVPLDFANQSHEVELIPYEDLWEIVLRSLETPR